jgi:hypothetical protein
LKISHSDADYRRHIGLPKMSARCNFFLEQAQDVFYNHFLHYPKNFNGLEVLRKGVSNNHYQSQVSRKRNAGAITEAFQEDLRKRGFDKRHKASLLLRKAERAATAQTPPGTEEGDESSTENGKKDPGCEAEIVAVRFPLCRFMDAKTKGCRRQPLFTGWVTVE